MAGAEIWLRNPYLRLDGEGSARTTDQQRADGFYWCGECRAAMKIASGRDLGKVQVTQRDPGKVQRTMVRSQIAGEGILPELSRPCRSEERDTAISA